MINTLVLVRHGKAQTRRDDMPDEQRKLTKPGRRALRAQFPRSFRLLEVPDGAEIQLWASPADRAMQTAQEAARVLGVKDIREDEALLHQDIDAFMTELESSSADTVVAVGHNPFMDQLAGRLCGAEVPFSTGGVAAFKMNDAEAEMPARLMWFVQGPQIANWKTLCAVEKALKSCTDTVEQRLAAFIEQPDDVEAIHKLRVSIRTLRSVAAFASAFQKKSQAQQVQDDLRFVLKPTSDLRDLDILTMQAQQLEPVATELVQACYTVRMEQRDRTLKALQGQKAVKALCRIRKAMHHVQWKSAVMRDGLDVRELNSAYALLLESFEAEWDARDLSDEQATHTLRKHAKRIRYIAENLGGMLDADTVSMSQTMTDVQDQLGALCDARVMLDVIDDFPVKGLSEQALGDLASLKARNQDYIQGVLAKAGQAGGESEGE